MIVSWNWLSDYVSLSMSAEVLAERLALTGLNHEGTEEVGGDLAIDLEVTSNRSDCLGHLGVAREVAAVFELEFREPDPRPPETGTPVTDLTAVDVEAPDVCPRFTARVVTGAKVGPSPWWLRKRLETLGLRSINNVVDITNYVMFECGQPLHAYDLKTLKGHRLVVRRAKKGERLVAINGKTYELDAGMLAIADAERPVGLAGVMGGLETEIGETTTDILIEAAQFDPLLVRKTSRGLGLSSPSSYRFERPMDPERTEWASRRCAELILELAGGALVPGLIDRASGPPPKRPATRLRFAQLPRVLGIDVPRDRAVAILEALGLERLETDEDAVLVRPPSWRPDLTREIDLVEEVARIYGYEHIPEDRPVPLVGSSLGRRERVERKLRETLTGLGFDEAISFSLVPDTLVAPLDPEPVGPPIRAEHPDFSNTSALRPSLTPSLLAARAFNEARGVEDARLFELADVYLTRPEANGADPNDGDGRFEESSRLGIVSGLDYFGLKGVIEALVEALHIPGELEARAAAPAPFAEGRAAELRLQGRHFGYLGEIDPARATGDCPRASTSAAELAFEPLLELAELVPRYRPVPTYPSVQRDLSLVVETSLPWSELAGAARSAAGPTLESLTFLDTFAGAGIPEGRHSLHFGLTFRHPERTLTGDEVDRQVQAIVEACKNRFEAALRG